MRSTRLLQAVLLTLFLATLPAAAQAPRAPIIIGGEVTGIVDTFLASGRHVDGFDGDFDVLDGLALGDVDGDGVDEIVIAEDTSTDINIFRAGGVHIRSWDSSYEAGDSLAAGDLNQDGRDEIVVANIIGGNVDIFDMDGNLLNSFGVDFTSLDGFAIGDVNGDGADEILVAGDFFGNVDIFDGAGNEIASFDGNYTVGDAFALGDLDGNGRDEILIVGDFFHDCEVFDMDGNMLGAFGVGYFLGDAIAAGDVLGDGRDEVLSADLSGNIEIYDELGNLVTNFDGDYSSLDAFAVGRNRYPDRDGDGLLDAWETSGYDADGDGTIDVPLPAMGANPNHKDLFLELDWAPGQQPTRAAVRNVKQAFALAPIDAGGIANPDGQPGINLWVDTGNLMEGSLPVGDNLGGGNEVPRVGALDGRFYDAKRDNFAVARHAIFRYAIVADPQDADTGGRGELGGNDFVSFNRDDPAEPTLMIMAGTLMHELGHNLNLHHGGNTGANCKPNYLSIMNYDHAFGINRVGFGTIIDFSPARTTAGARAQAPLPPLVENHLNESIVLDPTDHSNRTWFVTPGGTKMRVNMDGTATGIARLGLDWNVDGDHDDEDLEINIDTAGPTNACNNGSSDSTLEGHNDWAAISLPFRGFGNSADGPINPVLDPEPTTEELAALQRELNTTDLALSLSDVPDPAIAGTDLLYTIAVDNRGLNPAGLPRVVDVLPAGVSPSSLAGCAAAGATVTCDLAEIEFRERAELGLRVRIAPDLVYNAGGPVTLTNTASIDNLAGPDPAPGNNRANVDTRVVAVADLVLLGLRSPIDPPEVLIAEVTPVPLEETLTNRGPSAPMDATLNRTASAPPDSTVTPASSVETVVALGLQEVRRISAEYALRCGGVGHHGYRFTSAIRPARPDDTDSDLSNNSAALDLDIDCVVPVVIDVLPRIHLGSNGVITVKVLSTRAGEHGTPVDFDATTIDPATIRFGPRAKVWAYQGGAPETHGMAHGGKDRIFHFRTQETGIAPGDTEACVKGRFTGADGEIHKFFGCAPIRTTGP